MHRVARFAAPNPPPPAADAASRLTAPRCRKNALASSPKCCHFRASRNAPKMPPPDALISHADAKDALLRSGYLLESRVEAALRRSDYYVQANASYQDPLTAKSREFDLFAMRAEK